MRLLQHLLLILTATILSSAVTAQFEGFGGGEPKFCPPFRCPKGQEAVPTWPLRLESPGCSGMGGGMQIMSPGSEKDGANDPQGRCCDLRHACLQTCGAMKAFCDEEFKKCSQAACDNIDDADEKKTCESGAQVNQLMVQLDNNCANYDAAQRGHCECVAADQAPAKRERVLRAFYKKYNPEAVDKVPALVLKADTPAKFVGLLLKLYQKYPAVIKKIKDPQQEYMDRIMKEARDKEDVETEEEESDAEDLGTEEL